MSKLVRIEDTLYEQLKEEADNDGRSVTNYIDRKLRNGAPYAEYDKPATDNVYTNAQDEPMKLPDDFLTSPIGKPRTAKDVLAEINSVKAILASDLQYCQDGDTANRLNAKASKKLDELWAEWRELQ